MNPFELQKTKPADYIECKEFPCSGINKSGFVVPALDIDHKKIKVVMISEAPPEDLKEYFYAPG